MTLEPRLMASYFTLAGDVRPLTGKLVSPHSLAARATAAARAGYVGLGLMADDLDTLVAAHGYDGVRGIATDAGLEYLEFEVLTDWFADGERRAASDRMRDRLLRAAERIGPWQIKVGGDMTGGQWPLDRMTESFAELARQAGDAGTKVSIEIMPFSNIADLPTAIAIAKGADPAHGGLLLDVWHFYRGRIPYADIATIPPECIMHIELDDGDPEPVGSLLVDSVDCRKLPGEGSFDVPAFLAAVLATGYDGLYGVEILSDAHRSLTPAEAAIRSHDATLSAFERIEPDGR
jgi:sugar phosphate isomerase/epimerase